MFITSPLLCGCKLSSLVYNPQYLPIGKCIIHPTVWSYEPTLFHHGAPLYTSTTWAQLLQTMCLPDWLPNCGSTACRQAPWLASFCCQQGQPGEIKQWYCDPWVGSIKVNGPMVGSWGTLGLRFEEHTQNPNIMTCYAGGEECAQPCAFAKASPWISYPARRAPWRQARRSATWQCGLWAAHCVSSMKRPLFGFPAFQKVIFKAGALKPKPP